MIVMVIMIVASALMLALFSSFLPFVRNYGNVAQYTTAYYGALSAVERGVLATNYAGPGFDGESGRKASKQTQTPVAVWKTSDQRLQNFYTYGNGNDTLNWTVDSSTNSIPKAGDGNVDPVFVKPGEQNNYNALTYNTTEMIPLGKIDVVQPAQYYQSIPNSHTKFTPKNDVKVEIRLNPVLSWEFSQWGGLYWAGSRWYQLCEEADCGTIVGYTGARDKAIVNWTVKWLYGLDNSPFTLIPMSVYIVNRGMINSQLDTLIRASKINGNKILTFGSDVKLFDSINSSSPLAFINAISSKEQEIKDKKSYTQVFSESKDSVLQLELVNLLASQNRRIYPFLEYKVSSNTPLADRYYTIVGEGQVWDYNLRMQVKKPTLQQSALGSFTIIF